MENDKVFKFHLTNFSYFEINVSLFKAPPCDKHRTLKSKQKSAVGTNVNYIRFPLGAYTALNYKCDSGNIKNLVKIITLAFCSIY